jgi:ComF family protein
MLRTLSNSLVRIALGPGCAACSMPLSRPLDGAVCETCWRSVRRFTPPLCARCGNPLASTLTAGTGLCRDCSDNPPLWSVARSAGPYDEPLRGILHAFKYEHRRTLAGPLATLIREADGNVLDQVDAVVPVPLHPWRLMRRGFNQADDLACALGLPVWRVLRRRRLGPRQATLDGRARVLNVESAFVLRQREPWRHSRWRDRLSGSRVALVDDVMTTGATIEACTRVLVAAGAGRVSVLTVARTPIRFARSTR